MKTNTERLILRLPQRRDAKAMAEAIGNIEVARMLEGVPHPYTVQDALEWIALANTEWKEKSSYQALLMSPNSISATLIGVVGVHQFDDNNKTISLGYWIEKGSWGKGYATEAARAICEFAFGQWPIEKILSTVFDDNPASKRVLEKLGFQAKRTAMKCCISRGIKVAATEFELC